MIDINPKFQLKLNLQQDSFGFVGIIQCFDKIRITSKKVQFIQSYSRICGNSINDCLLKIMFYYGRITLYLFYFFLGYKYLYTKSGYSMCLIIQNNFLHHNIFTLLSYLIEWLYVVPLNSIIFCQFSKSRSIKRQSQLLFLLYSNPQQCFCVFKSQEEPFF